MHSTNYIWNTNILSQMNIRERVISQIKEKKSIDVSEFINICLNSNHGYYSNKNPIGKQKDFITAPEISQMFGEILGSYIINYWEENIGGVFNLIELGPGRGTLINDILKVGDLNKKFIKLMNLTLIEKNYQLINLQKSLIKNQNTYKPNWINDFHINNKYPSIIFSNEFFDCFPIKQFYKKEKWIEKYIEYNSVEDIFYFENKNTKDSYLINKLKKFNNYNVAEISLSREKYFNKICQFIKKNKGIIITIDYGYLEPINHFSLQTIYRHKKSHLFDNLGNQDITAFVDFGELINIAKENNLKIDTYCCQKDFLLINGLESRKINLQRNKDNTMRQKLEEDFKRLTENSQMGEDFKVLIVSCL